MNPPRAILVAVLTLTVLYGHPAAWATTTSESPVPVSAIVVRYQVGAPPGLKGGEPWGAQCVLPKDRAMLGVGRSLGQRMFTVTLNRPLRMTRALRIANGFALCPYVQWAEPDVPVVLTADR